jgi:hypothetical protein
MYDSESPRVLSNGEQGHKQYNLLSQGNCILDVYSKYVHISHILLETLIIRDIVKHDIAIYLLVRLSMEGEYNG